MPGSINGDEVKKVPLPNDLIVLLALKQKTNKYVSGTPLHLRAPYIFRE